MTDIDHEEADKLARDIKDTTLPSLRLLARAYLDLRARNERLREALAPFVLDDPAWTGPNDLQIELRAVDDQPQPCVCLGDIRRARQAYEEGGR